MITKLQVRRGLEINIPTLSVGELGLCTDTHRIYIGTNSGNILVNSTSGNGETTDYNNLINKPVLFSGDYNALFNRPTIPNVAEWALAPSKPAYAKSEIGLGNVDNTADNVKNVLSATKLATPRTINGIPFDGTADISIATGVGGGTNDYNALINKPTLSIVAGTGSYTDLLNKPTIDKNAVGLSNADNTADSVKNVLSATKLTTARKINGVNFDGTSDITLPSSGNTSDILKVKDFGAVGDGINDDTIAIQSAIDAISAQDGGELRFSKGTYLITSQLIGCSNITIVGDNATIKAGNTRISSALIKFSNCNNINVMGGITLDMNMQALPTYVVGDYDNVYNCGLHFESCSDVTIEKNIFKNLYTRGIMVHACTGALVIEKNKFYSPVQSQNQMIEHINIVTFTGKIDIHKNIFDNAPQSNANYGVSAMMVSGNHGQVDITKNKLNYCGRNNSGAHRLYAIDLYADTENVNIIDNISTNTIWGFTDLNGAKNAVVKNNKIYLNIAGDSGTIVVSTSPAYATGGVVIEGNKLYGNVAANSFGVTFGCNDWGIQEDNSRIINNVFEGIRNPILVYGALTDLLIHGNTIRHNSIQRVASAINLPLGNGVAPTETKGTKANAKFGKIIISNNTVEADGQCINLDAGGFTGVKTGNVKIDNNMLTGNGSTLGIVSSFLTVISTNNHLRDMNIAFYPRNNAFGYLSNNMIYNTSTAILNDGVTNLIKVNNYLNEVITS